MRKGKYRSFRCSQTDSFMGQKSARKGLPVHSYRKWVRVPVTARKRKEGMDFPGRSVRKKLPLMGSAAGMCAALYREMRLEKYLANRCVMGFLLSGRWDSIMGV